MNNVNVGRSIFMLACVIETLFCSAEPLSVELPLTGPAYAMAEDAYKAYARGDYKRAASKAKEALRLRPDVTRLRALLAKAQAARHAPATSIRAVARPPPDQAFAAADMAYKAYARGDYLLAISKAQDAAGRAPDNSSYWLLLVNAQISAGDFAGADKTLIAAMAQTGGNAALSARRTVVDRQLAVAPAASVYRNLEQGYVSAAIAAAARALAYDPNNPSYRLLLLTALLRGEQWAEAEQVATVGVAQNNDDVTPLLLRAYARQRLGQTDAARADFDLALHIAPAAQQRNTRLIAADAALAGHELHRAVEVLGPYTASSDDDIVKRLNAANAASRRSKASPAALPSTRNFPPPAVNCEAHGDQQICTLLPGLVPRDAGFTAAASAYQAYAAKDYDTTIAQAIVAVRLAPDNDHYHALLVNALLSAQRFAEAEQAASAALAAMGDDAAMYAERGHIRQRLGKPALASEDFAAALRVGGLPLQAEIGLLADSGQTQAARQKYLAGVQADAFQDLADTDLAYLAARVGDDQQAVAAFARADRAGKLPDTALADAAYSAIRAERDKDALNYFKRSIDAHAALRLRMEPQLLFDTRRSVATVSREGGFIASLSQRGSGSSAATGATPGATGSGGLQAGFEAYWRPFGYQNGRTFEVFGRVFETLQDRAGGDTGAATLQGAIGARYKPLSDENLVLSAARLVPLGRQASSDWLAQIAYSASIGTDLNVISPDWWTVQGYAEAGRYFVHPQNYGLASLQLGRSYRLGDAASNWVAFPYLTFNADYNSLNTIPSAIGSGPGMNMRYWFRGDLYNAPRSFIELSLQYRLRLEGDERARGVFVTSTLSY